MSQRREREEGARTPEEAKLLQELAKQGITGAKFYPPLIDAQGHEYPPLVDRYGNSIPRPVKITTD